MSPFLTETLLLFTGLFVIYRSRAPPINYEIFLSQIDWRKIKMAYNKARAEKEWLKWKTAEEKKLRELGVDEDTIQRLHMKTRSASNARSMRMTASQTNGSIMSPLRGRQSSSRR